MHNVHICILDRTLSHTVEFSAIVAIFHLFLRLVSSYCLYYDWGDRRGVVAMTVTKGVEAGSVRSGSVLTHYPGYKQSSHPANHHYIIHLFRPDTTPSDSSILYSQELNRRQSRDLQKLHSLMVLIIDIYICYLNVLVEI